MFAQTKVLHLFVGHFDSCLIVLGDETAVDDESGGGGGFTDEFEDQRVVLQGDARPVFADLAEETMLDGIPFGGAGGKVTDGDRELIAVDQLLLEGPLPGPRPIAVAPTPIGQNEQMSVRAVEALSRAAPPVADGLDGKLRGVVSHAHIDRAPIGLEIIDPIGDGHAEGFGTEIMILDEHGLSAPAPARILEAPHQLFLFGINADDGLSLSDKALALSSNMAKLLVPPGPASSGKIFAVAAQGDAQLTQQTTNGVGTDGEAQLGQSLGDLTQTPMRPGTAASHGIARQRVG